MKQLKILNLTLILLVILLCNKDEKFNNTVLNERRSSKAKGLTSHCDKKQLKSGEEPT